MPALTKRQPNKILVTGANGFVGTWIVRTALEYAYSVRAAVRSEKSGIHLLKTFEQYGDKLELCFVGDIAEDGAFDKVVKDVQGIVHTASPVILTPIDAKDVIIPAVNGAVGILKSAMKNGNSVKRIVFTSSCSAIVFSTGEKQIVCEKDWNEVAVADAEKPSASKYSASKVLAEKAVWGFYNAHRSRLLFDITVLNPPFIFGPGIHSHASPSDLRPVCNFWYDVMIKSDFDDEDPLTEPGHGWVDVRDVAEAHVRSLEARDAGGERIIVSAGGFVWQDWLDVAHCLPASELHGFDIPKGKQGEKTYAITFDTAKEKRILGMKFKGMAEMTSDVLADFRSRG